MTDPEYYFAVEKVCRSTREVMDEVNGISPLVSSSFGSGSARYKNLRIFWHQLELAGAEFARATIEEEETKS